MRTRWLRVVGVALASAAVLVAAVPASPVAATTATASDGGSTAAAAAAGWGRPTDGAVSVEGGAHHACVLRVDQTIYCWGSEHFGQSSAPDGQFRSLSVGIYHSCAIRLDDTVACWGGDDYGRASPPGGTFAQVSAGGDHSCGIRTDGTVACWGSAGSPESTPPPGTFTQVLAQTHQTCGIRPGGAVECWGRGLDVSRTPDGPFAELTGRGQVCGVRPDGTARCWHLTALDYPNQLAYAPDGTFTDLAPGIQDCGLRPDGEIECWELLSSQWFAEAPPGPFIGLGTGVGQMCGIRPDRTLDCWDVAPPIQVLSPPWFLDVSGYHPFRAEIGWMAAEGIATGYPDLTFRPTDTLDRQSAAAFLFRAIGDPDFAVPSEPTFADVGPDHPFHREVEWMAAAGMTVGYGDGTFGPMGDVSRQAIAAFLHRAAGSPPHDVPDGPVFADVPRNHPFAVEVDWLRSVGITTGYEDDTFRPAASATRQDAAAFLYRFALLTADT
jgi:hypothetical protein